jgi:hypothetical protein
MNSNGLGAGAAARVAAITGLRPAPTEPAPALPTAALAEGPGNVLMVTLLGRNAVAAMTRVGSNNGVETWRTAKGVTLSFRDGILVASRGLGGDLMGANVDGVLAAILRGTGTAQRRHAFLDSEDQIQTSDLTCTFTTDAPEVIAIATGTVEATKVTEVCESPVFVFTNQYWLSDTEIVQSRQAVSVSAGYIRVNIL